LFALLFIVLLYCGSQGLKPLGVAFGTAEAVPPRRAVGSFGEVLRGRLAIARFAPLTAREEGERDRRARNGGMPGHVQHGCSRGVPGL